MKGDGIYTRYFSASMGGTGDYTFEVTVTDNGNTAYTWQYGHQYEGPLITSKNLFIIKIIVIII